MYSPRENEKIIRVFNYHWAVLLPHFVLGLGIVVLDFFLLYWLFTRGAWGVALFVAVLALVAFYLWRLLYLYHRNRVLVTTLGIVIEESPKLFEKAFGQYSFAKISEVKAVAKGPLAALFHYGEVRILIKDSPAVILSRVAEPFRLQNMIHERVSLVLSEEKSAEQASAKKLLARLSVAEREKLLAEIDEN